MTAEDINWFRDQPLLVGYIACLFAGSLLSFIRIVRQVSQSRRLGTNPIPAWPLGNTDFALFLVCLILWFVLSGSILLHLYNWIADPDGNPGTGIMVIGGFLLQAGMLYLFLRFRFHFRTAQEGPISPKIISLPRGFQLGLFYFLASLPVVYGVGIVWNGFLEFLRQRGIEIELPLQDAVLLLQETKSPLTFIGLVLLAVVIAPIVEETVFRAGIFRFFKGKVPLWAALLISGAMFGLIHGNLQSLPGLIAVGVCLGLAYELSGSLRVPIFFHAFFNLNSIIWILLIPESLVA